MAEAAARYLLAKLTEYQNTVGPDHETALRGLLWLAQELTDGQLQGRYRFGLPCGMGKTTAVRAFIRTVNALGLPHRVTVACSRVEQLCHLKRTLITEDGVAPVSIGLMHSFPVNPLKAADGFDGYASEPSEGHSRQFLLVTHARVRNDEGKVAAWMADRSDALLFYDESLVVGEALTLPLRAFDGDSVEAEAGGFGTMRTMTPDHGVAAEWIDSAVAVLRAAGDSIAEGSADVRIVETPPLTERAAGAILRLQPFAFSRFPKLAALVQQARDGVSFRVFVSEGTKRVLVSYVVTVPDELRNLIVLDASDPIRELVHHDKRMCRAEDAVPLLRQFRHIPGGLSSIKRYDRVRIHVATEGSGRGSMRAAFNVPGTPAPVEKLVKLIADNPAKRFLVFTFKDKFEDERYGSRIYRALERAGIDPLEGMTASKPGRVSILTWGQETATNAYKDCDAVVLLGVIFQPREAVAGAYLGQVDNIRAPGLATLARHLQHTECVHSIYQASNRGQVRLVDVVDRQSQARPCDVYIIHSDAAFKERLAVVMPGASWHAWREAGEDLSTADVSLKISAKLTELADVGVRHVSLRSLKRDVAPDVPATTWKSARAEALRSLPWRLKGQSLVLMFADETEAA